MQAVARALIQNNYITELLLCDNAIRSEGSVYIAKLLQENINITKIDISENEIGSIGAHNVAQVLQENNSLLSINLSENLFKDIDASVLAQALERNYGLRHLNLSRNKFSQEAGISLGKLYPESVSSSASFFLGFSLPLSSINISFANIPGSVLWERGCLANTWLYGRTPEALIEPYVPVWFGVISAVFYGSMIF